MNTFFTDMGRNILNRWKRENFSLEAFPGIAHAALQKHPPARQVDLAAFLREFLLDDEQPIQTDSPFGEPEIVVYSHPRFYIQLLFWLDGTTAIHQHEFSGAFHVMQGSSIHSHYEFEGGESVTPYLRVGNVRLKKIELLTSGRTVPIISGRQNIHSLFHLDSPSITVVIRTQHDPGTGPQFNYLPPHLAIDPHHGDSLLNRRQQLLDVLEQVEDPGYAGLVMAMVTDLDFERGFYLLRHCMGHLQSLGEWDSAIRAFEKKHKALAGGVQATLSEEVRRSAIKEMRSMIIEPEHRFFLALLMNAPTRADLFSLVTQRFPKQSPATIVGRWAQELLELSEDGVTLLDASFPESLHVDSASQPDLFLSALSYFMTGGKNLPAILRGLSASDIKQIHTAFTNSTLNVLIA